MPANLPKSIQKLLSIALIISALGISSSITTSVAYAIPKELLSCEGKQGSMVQKCVLRSQILIGSQPHESDFFVSYKMTCNRGFSGPKPTKIIFKLENNSQFGVDLNANHTRLKVGTGMGPLTIVDTKPADLKNLVLNSCSLVVNDIIAEKSAKTKALEEAKKAENRRAMTAFLNATREQMSFNKSLLLSEQSNLYYRSGQKLEMYCLIKTWNSDPLYEEIVSDMVNKFESLYGRYEDASVSCDSKSFVQLSSNGMTCNMFNPDALSGMLSNKELPLTSRVFFEGCLSELNYQKVLVWFESIRVELKKRMEEIKAMGMSDLSQEASLLENEISITLTSTCTGTSASAH